MRVLVLGAYGLIGSDVVRRLRGAGLDVVGFGRAAAKAKRLNPHIAWRIGDLNRLIASADWVPYLSGIDAVVNASGALQDGAKDSLADSQDAAIRACIAACEAHGVRRFVQISAPGATADASTSFLRTKARADEALRQSALTWTILKPGLVISAYAYGGTALLRMLAAFPVMQPLVSPQARMQTVAASDVTETVLVALTTDRLAKRDIDLVEADSHTLTEVVGAFRSWLGFAPARAVFAAPGFAGAIAAGCADLAGWLGWRSPLRSTALRVLSENVLGDATSGAEALGRPLLSLSESLAQIPATLQERVSARAQLVFPVLALVLAGFWIASGLIALARVDVAAAVLSHTALAGAAPALVIGGGILDIGIGVAVCVRRTVRSAALAAAAVSLLYLALATMVTPELWADPLGPLVKVLPGGALALVVAALAEDR